MLLLIEVDLILKKRDCKQNLVRLGNSGNGKVVLTLLTKVVTFYMGSTTIYVKGLDFELVSK